MPTSYGNEDAYNEFGVAGGPAVSGSWQDPNATGASSTPTPAPRPDRGGNPEQDLLWSGSNPNTPKPPANPYAGWGVEDWARQLKDPSLMNAAQLEYAIARGLINPQMAQDALVLKDSWLRRSQQQSTGGWGGYGGNGWMPQGTSNPTAGSPSATFTPFGITPLQGDWNNPTNRLRIEDANMLGIAPEYRAGIYDWLGQQGFRGQGGLGQFGYRDWQAQKPQTFDQNAFNYIPDQNLRQWAMKLFGKG